MLKCKVMPGYKVVVTDPQRPGCTQDAPAGTELSLTSEEAADYLLMGAVEIVPDPVAGAAEPA